MYLCLIDGVGFIDSVFVWIRDFVCYSSYSTVVDGLVLVA